MENVERLLKWLMFFMEDTYGIITMEDGIMDATTMSSNVPGMFAAGMSKKQPQPPNMETSSCKISGDQVGPMEADTKLLLIQMATVGVIGRTRYGMPLLKFDSYI